jgi:hypothetical protein
MAQLNVSSSVAVLSMIGGVGLARLAPRSVKGSRRSPSVEPVRD